MKIYVIDNDKNFLNKFESELKLLGFFNTKFFDFDKQSYIINHPPELLIFRDINNGKKLIKKLNKINKKIYFLIISSQSIENFYKYFDLDIFIYLKSNYSLIDLNLKLKLINNFLKKINKLNQENKKLKKQLEYKNIQEELAIVKQKKLLKNELCMFFENEHLIESYIKPKDILSGDALFSKRIKENEYILCIVDAMGKGLNASLTSITTLAFLEYSIDKSIKMKDFDFKRSVADFFNYTRAMLLNNESLSAILVYIKNNKLLYANFGMPPIYTPKEKFKANNPSIMKVLKSFEINEVELPNKFFIISDGLIESRLKNSKSIYYKRFLNLLEIPFLKNLVEDFEKNAVQDDDISIIHYKKDKIKDKKFEINAKIKNKKSVDEVLQKIPKCIKNYEKVVYVLQELLMNTLEHSIFNLQMKKEYMSLNSLNEENKDKCVCVNIKFFNKDKLDKIEYEEESNGFDINILKDLYDVKYHGKGIKIIKFLSEGIFFNYKGNKIKIFLKDKK